MEEKPSKVSLKSSDRHDSDKESGHSDIRDLWTRTTLSQAQLNMPLSEVCEGFDAEGRSISKTRGWYSPGSRSLDEGDKASHKPEELDEHALVELELHRGSSMEINLGEKDTASQIEAEKSSSMSSLNIAKHTPHRAYWAEQQSRLPLPLMELMENEALEILTKALRSYQLGIGRDHFLTKELQRYIEGLKKRRSKRLYVN
ncbi:cation channel sperm-associated protein subunit zeta isoform X1 [Trachypithecus francoisi]|uniref:cation channel sperm-associated protein subunit zeta isoform X1 n=1 Tax=Trachypithecus francoisi TaxID=54180 RepID=UPI00141B98FF|nr:cation channel sperm-associated protein subunit zeta isoform X1 [Trachypithecus francoisi]